MAHLFEDIADSFKYFRGLRNRKKLEKVIKEKLESGYYVVSDADFLFGEQNKGDKK